MSKKNKIKTYEFMYEAEGDDFECVQFCASTRKEARKLFFEYLKDEKLVLKRLYSIEEVYNEDDASYYGENYAWRA